MDEAEVFLREWDYKERVVKGAYYRLVYDIYIDTGGSKYYVAQGLPSEEIASYIVRMHNDIIEGAAKFPLDK